jgi:hypothetical protein
MLIDTVLDGEYFRRRFQRFYFLIGRKLQFQSVDTFSPRGSIRPGPKKAIS